MAVRAILACFGLFALVAPPLAFRGVLLQPSLFAIPFWIITLGAAAVGGTTLLAVIVAEDTVLEVSGGTIRLSRRNPFHGRTATQSLAADDIVDIGIRTVEWDSGPDTFALQVRLKHGRPVGSDDFARREDAEALAARLRRAIGRT